jgi:hypothetical protein
MDLLIFSLSYCVCAFLCVCVFLYVGDSKSERALERVSSENILLCVCVYYVVTIIVFHRLATFVLQVLLQLGDRD